MAIPARALTIPTDRVVQSILVLRGHRVILDSELAALYGVSTKRFHEQVRRNRERFPPDFMFQLTAEELRQKAGRSAELRQRGHGDGSALRLPIQSTIAQAWQAPQTGQCRLQRQRRMGDQWLL